MRPDRRLVPAVAGSGNCFRLVVCRSRVLGFTLTIRALLRCSRGWKVSTTGKAACGGRSDLGSIPSGSTPNITEVK